MQTRLRRNSPLPRPGWKRIGPLSAKGRTTNGRKGRRLAEPARGTPNQRPSETRPRPGSGARSARWPGFIAHAHHRPPELRPTTGRQHPCCQAVRHSGAGARRWQARWLATDPDAVPTGGLELVCAPANSARALQAGVKFGACSCRTTIPVAGAPRPPNGRSCLLTLPQRHAQPQGTDNHAGLPRLGTARAPKLS